MDFELLSIQQLGDSLGWGIIGLGALLCLLALKSFIVSLRQAASKSKWTMHRRGY